MGPGLKSRVWNPGAVDARADARSRRRRPDRAANPPLLFLESLADRQCALARALRQRRRRDDILVKAVAARHPVVDKPTVVVVELELTADGAVERVEADIGDARLDELLGRDLGRRQALLHGARRKTGETVMDADTRHAGQHEKSRERAA